MKLLIVVAAIGLIALPALAIPPPQTFEQIAETVQDYYPVGSSVLSTGERVELYLMPRRTTIPTPTTAAVAFLANGRVVQIVETNEVDCTARTMRPNFRASFTTATGKLLDQGPVTPKTSASVADVAQKAEALAILCNAKAGTPPLRNRTLADFR